jgi:hypothetical protein
MQSIATSETVEDTATPVEEAPDRSASDLALLVGDSRATSASARNKMRARTRPASPDPDDKACDLLYRVGTSADVGATPLTLRDAGAENAERHIVVADRFATNARPAPARGGWENTRQMAARRFIGCRRLTLDLRTGSPAFNESWSGDTSVFPWVMDEKLTRVGMPSRTFGKGPVAISVVVPVYKEEGNIQPFLDRIVPVLVSES